jgi:acyl-coenzyme A thioesterase PaaI-like protein
LTAWSDGFAEMHLDAQPHLGNRTGRVQGGVICTLLDAVAGYAGLYRLPDSPQPESVTLSLTTNFLDSGNGAVLVAKGMLERRGRGIYFARSELWLDSAVLLATAVGTFKYVGRSSRP